VYFPIDGILSIVSLTEDGTIAEAYTAGRDGMAGGEALLDADRQIFRTMCQVPGVFYSMSRADFVELAERDPALTRTVYLYLHCMISLTGQSAACNLLHGLTERCARWLLLTHDRVGKDSFDLTHDILSTMLGVHRPAVTIAAGTLQKAGLISYTRGRITITDRSALENASCECYGIVQREFKRVLGGP
jgi:CRP-like cAMP-binding protein